MWQRFSFFQLVFLMSIKSSFIFLLCCKCCGKNKYIFSLSQTYLRCLLIFSFPSYEAVESVPCFLLFGHHFMRTKPFYQNMVRDLHSRLFFFFSWEIFFPPIFWNRGFRKTLFSPWTRRGNQWDWTSAIQSPGCNCAKLAKNTSTFSLHRHWWQWEKWSDKHAANV